MARRAQDCRYIFPDYDPSKRNQRCKPLTTDEQIAEMIREGRTYDEIQREKGASPKRIARIAKAVHGGTDLPQVFRGRPKKVSPQVIEYVRNVTTDDPLLGSRGLAHEISRQLGLDLSRQTVNAIRKMLHFIYTTPRSRPALTQAHIESRLRFCEASLSGEIDWAGDVIISDESRFGLYDDSRRLWLQRGVYSEHTFRDTPKFSKSLMVWGAIGLGYKSEMIFIDGTLNAERYRSMLDDNHVLEGMIAGQGERQVRFQQDGAPAHRAKGTVAHIEEQLPVIPDWPANSPDLSVIENIWAILKRRIASRAPKSLPELKAILKEEWNGLDQHIIDDLIRSIPERFKLCIEENGHSIGHLLNRTQTKRTDTIGIQTPLDLPSGILIPRFLKVTDVSRVIQCYGIVVGVSDVRGDPRYFWTEIEDPPECLGTKMHPMVLLICVHLADNSAWVHGHRVLIEGKVLAQTGRLPFERTGKSSRPERPLQLFLEFQSFKQDPFVRQP